MTIRDELIDIILRAIMDASDAVPFSEFLADYLLAQGVRRINVGDTAYVLRTDTKEAVQGTVSQIRDDSKRTELWVEVEK